MRTENSPTIHLKDYQPPAWMVDHVSLDFYLDPKETRVVSRLDIRPNIGAGKAGQPLVLDGTGLVLRRIAILGRELEQDEYTLTENRLILRDLPAEALTVEIETSCDPQSNTALSGLYRTGDIYCTQCEAEGFRRITYFPDRPDILSKYRVRIEADKQVNPVLLSNGNKVLTGDIKGTGRHFSVWEDPFPKPCYLFALVAGKLARIEDSFITRSGRKVMLEIYVQPGKEDRCDWAMDSLKRAMAWDEEVFGREYDLDVFMIVAVPDFNMGAMENKGLNIFNDKYIMALPETATDNDYANIEAIIAHEYFHNWSGNRVTCRDWFQLCLKEGLTVFRDQEFSADQRSRAVTRIDDVKRLRAQQFPEDAGPLAHPVRPSSYMEINNFYTATVYEKGAEIIRMLQTLIGRKCFRQGMDLYFSRYDGQAVTMEDFIACMSEVSGRALEQFFLWYEQAGTPHVSAEGKYDQSRKSYQLKLTQTTPPTPDGADKKPFHIPVKIGLVDADGNDMELKLRGGEVIGNGVLELRKTSQTYVFENIGQVPVLSINRTFSAPVRLTAHQTFVEKLRLAQHDSDLFNRWEAGQKLGQSIILATMQQMADGAAISDRQCLQYAEMLAEILRDRALEPAFKARMLQLPSETDLAGLIGTDVDPQLIHEGREHVRALVGRQLMDLLQKAWQSDNEPGFSPDAQSAGRRALNSAALSLIAAGDQTKGSTLACKLFETATDMTSEMAALATLCRLDGNGREEKLEQYYDRHKNDHLLVDKWFMLHAQVPFPETLGRIRELMNHPAFSLNRPNNVRALIGSFAMANPVCFHAPDGSGYELVGDVILELDSINPQVAARLASAFRSWRMLEEGRGELAKGVLERLYEHPGLSKDTFEIIEKSLTTPMAQVQ